MMKTKARKAKTIKLMTTSSQAIIRVALIQTKTTGRATMKVKPSLKCIINP